MLQSAVKGSGNRRLSCAGPCLPRFIRSFGPASVPATADTGTAPRTSADEFWRNPELIAGIEFGSGRRIIGGAHVGNRVEKLVVVGAGLTLIGGIHAPPLIPRKHLDLVQRSKVLDCITAYLSWPPISGPVDTELCGVNLASAEGLPRLAASEELTWAQVFWLRQDRLTDDLRVDPHPPLVFLVPVLSDPVVEALPRLEVGRDSAAARSSTRRSAGRCRSLVDPARAEHPVVPGPAPVARRSRWRRDGAGSQRTGQQAGPGP